MFEHSRVGRALRWWFGFWFGPAGRSTSVWLVWLGLTVAVLGFIRRYGQNIPSWEEWVFLPGLLGERSQFGWVFERLQEHRYPLGRAVFLGLFEAVGRDFRVGMYASAALLSAAAAALLRAAAAIRGRNDYPDILLPALVLNVGGCENLILGYQVPFALNVLLAAILVRSAASPSSSGGRLFADGVVLALLALGGWIGLAFVPGGVVWIAWRVWNRFRRDGSVIRALCLALLPVASVAWFLWCYADVNRNPLPGAEVNDPGTAARVWAEFLAGAVGSVAHEEWPWTGVVGVGLFAGVGLTLVRDLARSADRRATAAGWLVVLSAVALMGYGLAQRRPSGFAVRNLPFVALLSALAYLLLVRHAVRWPAVVRWAATPVAWLLAVLLFWHGWRAGVDVAGPHWERNIQFERERPTGLPLNFLASRHQLFPHPELRDSLRLLRDTGHPAAAGIPDAPPMRVDSLAVGPPTREAIPDDPFRSILRGNPRVWRFDPGPRRAVVGVRVRFDYQGDNTGVLMHVLWRRADGTIGTASSRPWLTRFTWELDFWVDEPVGPFWFRSVDEDDDRLTVLSVQLLLPPP